MKLESKKSPVPLFMRHLSPIWLTLRKGGKEHCPIVSAFVISIRGEWLLLTAGHCLREIEQQQACGYRIERSYLIDDGAAEARFSEAIPFNFEDASPMHLNDDYYDYGVLRLPDNTKALMESNGIVALDEAVWERQPSKPDGFQLLGIPTMLAASTKKHARFSAALMSVTEVDERPDCFEPNNAPTFYGRIPDDERLPDIAGMSGGPVFSFKRYSNGELRYWLHAVQSGWVKERRLIAACKTTPFISWIRDSLFPASDGYSPNPIRPEPRFD
jgi:hypothetical protein